MSSYETSSLVISAFGLILSTVVLLLLFQQIRLLSRQVKDSKRALDHSVSQAGEENIRLKQRATMDFLAGTMSKLQEVYNDMPPAGSPNQDAYSVAAQVRDSAEFVSVRNYLNYLEDLSVAVNMQIFDSEVVYRVVGGRMYRAWQNYVNWIMKERELLSSPGIYCELEICVEEVRVGRGLPVIHRP